MSPLGSNMFAEARKLTILHYSDYDVPSCNHIGFVRVANERYADCASLLLVAF